MYVCMYIIRIWKPGHGGGGNPLSPTVEPRPRHGLYSRNLHDKNRPRVHLGAPGDPQGTSGGSWGSPRRPWGIPVKSLGSLRASRMFPRGSTEVPWMVPGPWGDSQGGALRSRRLRI